ncbi:WD40/YVTN/BNR-like repeat-containing protein [Sphingomonas humi]|uniref:Sortilin N-terminal domain-containing protein n=1 Tax=Sphingomonas humi TaxID=335630 RepID=A0ABP7RNB8_9SPHN
MTLRLAALVALLVAAPAAAQVERNIPTTPFSVDETYLSGLKWRNIGPNRGGRSIAAAGSTARPLEYYFGAVGGGLWKTNDGGTSWKPVTDKDADNSAVGGVAVCEANPDIVYFTTGETELRGNIMPGNGVYRSTDAGKTWKNVGLKEVQNFSRVRIDPTDCNNVFVGGFGRYSGASADRGVFKSSDGGTTWRKVLYRDPKTGAVDLSIDPKNPKIIYAAMWEAFRKPWGMSSGGPGSGLFKSVDGGEHWSELTRNPGMPKGLIGKIGVSVSPVDGNRVYALVENHDGGVFVSDDAGATWKRTNDSRDLRQRAFYYTRITADTKNKDRVYVTNVQFFRSDDGGKTFPTKIKVPHGDNHDLWIAPNDNQRMIEANDGGANVSVNGGQSWTRQDYPTAQMYRVAISNHFPYFACGGQQDNSTICVPSKGWRHVNSLGGQYGFAVGGGESGYVANDPLNPNIFYAGSYGGTLDRFDYATGQRRAVNVVPDNPMGYSAADIGERFQWTYPIVFDPQDKNILYVSSQHVFRTSNGGNSWERISPDLTLGDPKTLAASGGPITLDQTGVETYGTVFALTPSRLEKDVIWAGSDDGLVHVTRDNGRTWQNVTPKSFPKYLKITTIEDSPHRPGTAYLTGHLFLLDDMRPYIFKTTDYGRTWTPITRNIPSDEIVRSIREDKVRPGLLFAGTERGVWVSFDDGQNWQKLQRNLPATQVADLAVTDHDLVIATHGRSFWVLDNIDVLRQLDGRSGTKAVQLFRPAPAVRGVDPGVIIDYFLPATPAKLSIDILDPAGKVVRTFEGAPEPAKTEATPVDEDEDEPKPGPKPTLKPGLNRYTWDMRYPGFTEFRNMILWSARNRGPLALPGQYSVRLTVDGKVDTQPADIRLDPRIATVSQADLQKRFELANQIREKVSSANEAVLLVRGVAGQIEERNKQSKVSATREAGERLEERLRAIEGRIYQVRNRSRQDPLNYPIMLNNKLAALGEVVESAEAAPTQQSYVVFADLSQRLDRELAALDQLLAAELPRLNARLTREGLPPVERRAEAAVEPGSALGPGGEEEDEEEEEEGR